MNLIKYLSRTEKLNPDPILEKNISEKFKPINISDTKVTSKLKTQIINLRKNYTNFQENDDSTAISIVVPYRNRSEHLLKFIPHVSSLLKKKRHEIIIVEQDNNLPFNIGILRNYGTLVSKFEQIVHHDIDFLPKHTNYSGGNQPLRLLTKVKNESHHDTFIPNSVESSSSKDRVLDSYFSGVITISKQQHFLVNGYPNNFFGWGEEDNEFLLRCLKVGLVPFYLEASEFFCLPHISNADNTNLKENSIKRKLRKSNGKKFRMSRLGITNYWDSGMNNLQDLITEEKCFTDKIDGYEYKHIKINFKLTT
jgi:hypothetical protein